MFMMALPHFLSRYLGMWNGLPMYRSAASVDFAGRAFDPASVHTLCRWRHRHKDSS
jgi:hypothetical protein